MIDSKIIMPSSSENIPFFPTFGADEEVAALRAECGLTTLSTIRLSWWYLSYCISAALLSVTLTILLAIRYRLFPPPWRLVILDGILVLSLGIEVALELILLKSNFFHNGWHLCDLGILLLSVLGFIILSLEAAEQINKENDGLMLLFTASRYISQTIRALRYMISAKGSRDSRRAVVGDVTFPVVYNNNNSSRCCIIDPPA